MADQRSESGAMTDAQVLARVWDWASQAVEPIDAPAIARGAATRVPLLSSVALRVNARGLPAPAVRWPAYGLVLLLVALLAWLVAGALLVGSRHHDIPEQRLPAPFGPARNGVIVVSLGVGAERSLVQFDPATGSTATLRSGAWLVEPLFSPDGRQIMFEELTGSPPCCEGVLASLWVMNADGSGSRQLVPNVPVGTVSGTTRAGAAAWAPEGDRILVSDEGWLSVIDVASGTSVRHSLGIDIVNVSWRPNHEQVLLSGDASGAHLVNADGTGLRSLPTGGRWSPDGSTIAYNVSTGRVDAVGHAEQRVHILSVDSGIERELTFDGSDGTSEVVAEFSPDGTRLLIFRNTGNHPTSCGSQPVRICLRWRPIIVPVAGGGPEVMLGTFDFMAQAGDAMFSPDGKQVLGFYGDPHGVWLYDADTGEAAAMTGPGWESLLSGWGMTWQRLAP